MINSTLKNAKILVVDDQQANINVITDLFDILGYTNVKTTTDPREVLDIFRKFNPDLILLDLMMPYLNGFQVMEKLKGLVSDNTFLPILVLTADVSEEAKKRALAGGAKDFLTKPFNLAEIALRIKNLLETRYLHLQLQAQNQILEIKVNERTLELENANRELQVLDQAKSDFLSIIGHEINTPLNGILGFIEILKTELKELKHLELLNYLEVSANRLARFSKVSMLITRLKTNNNFILNENVSIAQLIESGTENIIDQINARGVKLITEGNFQKLSIRGEPFLLEFCFKSLLKNAIKYTPDDSTVTIRIIFDKKQIVCTFSDQGTGFSSKALKNLFKLFIPGEKHTGQNKGLDLALVKLIMNVHKGEIVVKNNKIHGATVTLTFPVL